MLPKTVICDDDQMMLELMVNFCQELDLIRIVGTANTGKKALEVVKEKAPDILLLDIDLPDLDGIEVARQLSAFNPFLKIIFITCHDDFYAEAFQTYAYDYISKVTLTERLPRTLKKLQNELMYYSASQHCSRKVCISFEGRDYYINLDKIIYISSRDRKTRLVTEGGTFEVYGPLYKWDEFLTDYFYNCHRSYIVNLHKIEIFEREEGSKLVMTNGDEVPVSRRKTGELKKILHSFVLN